MERQCWANTQYSRRECVEVAGVPQSVPASDLEKKFGESCDGSSSKGH